MYIYLHTYIHVHTCYTNSSKIPITPKGGKFGKDNIY